MGEKAQREKCRVHALFVRSAKDGTQGAGESLKAWET